MNVLLIGVFFTVFTSDIFWTCYIRRAAEGKALQAAIFSALILLTAGVNTISYIENRWITMLPASLGAFCGTLVAMSWEKRRHEKR